MKFNEQAQVFHKQQIAALLMVWFIFMFQLYRYCFTAISQYLKISQYNVSRNLKKFETHCCREYEGAVLLMRGICDVSRVGERLLDAI